MLISVPATSANLGPGFDSLGLAIDLRNQIIITPSKFLSLSTIGEGASNPKIRKNTLFLTIFNENYKRLTDRIDNFKFEFINNIPISRGLGSSSAVIVASITAAYAMSKTKYNKREILNLALKYEHHPDNITPAVMGGFNVACIDDNKVYSQKRRLPNYLKAILVIPNKTISTARSRNILPNQYKAEETIYSLSRSAFMTSVFMSESWDLLRVASQDKLHQTRRMKAMPELFDVQKSALDNGVLMSTLSGSGSTFFNLCYEQDANKIANILKNKFPKFKIIVKSLDNYGVTTKS